MTIADAAMLNLPSIAVIAVALLLAWLLASPPRAARSSLLSVVGVVLLIWAVATIATVASGPAT